ncbi:uracil-DNA glycosylase [Rhizobium sp. KVB221]|uniref:Uracil-DNA glycosylase n=1 Tax=Rhizobium setariae TaxID=2801340 RepID=A0A936YKZ9_9HYPH|nr:uracil-DNA glycosylase [Rhizobium setariae]MBL0372344.1 uracil-DNA glycosylase [Rhizobium setariae]
MNSVPVAQLSSPELAQLMHFYAESGVEWMLEDVSQDRFAEFEAFEARRSTQTNSPVADRPVPVPAPATPRQQAQERGPTPHAPQIAVPAAEVIVEAQRIAASATTVQQLAEAVSAFGGCNLRNSARSTAFMAGNPAARIVVAGGLPGADDDREGAPFSGVTGGILTRMLAGISIAADEVMMFNFIPWRPPGSRPPTLHEVEICKPFGLRLIELVRPVAVLALGNYPARYLSGSDEGIHSLRGRFIDIEAGTISTRLFATFHPQDLIAAPLNKRLAWQDLLAFNSEISN